MLQVGRARPLAEANISGESLTLAQCHLGQGNLGGPVPCRVLSSTPGFSTRCQKQPKCLRHWGVGWRIALDENLCSEGMQIPRKVSIFRLKTNFQKHKERLPESQQK